MGIIKLPVGFHDDYMKLVRNFWWGEDEMKRKVHWATWDILTSPKDLVGVGFRDSRLMNQALLARQCWRIIKNPNNLCARLVKSIYYPRGNFLDTVFRQDVSHSWHGIEHGLELIKEGISSRIGNGNNVNIWRDNWLPRDYNLKVTKDSRSSHAVPSMLSSWMRPSEGETKINVDAAFCPASGESAAGVVIRDHRGAVILAASMVGTKFRDAEEAEAIAIYEGLKIAIDYNLSHASLESDCATAVAAVNRQTMITSRN
ncbi:hypothetical protein ACQ4PT_023020 [Festuca glaucescens]